MNRNPELNPVNTLRPRQNGRHFADDISKCIFLNENAWILIKISLKFVPKGSINNIPALVQIMAWRRPGDKPLSEPMMVRIPTHICVTRPQWVKLWNCSLSWTFNSLWLGDILLWPRKWVIWSYGVQWSPYQALIWHHRCVSTLDQVMACCLMATWSKCWFTANWTSSVQYDKNFCENGIKIHTGQGYSEYFRETYFLWGSQKYLR